MINKEIAALFCAGLIQGISLVAFPAASTILTDPDLFDFSSTDYGSLFIPQAFFSIVAAACNPALNNRFRSKSVFLLGLIANMLSMIFLALSALFVNQHSLAYLILITATTCLGLGFGLLVPTLNLMAALLKPKNVNSILLFLNALLGVGTALAPIFISLFVHAGFWWGLPCILAWLFLFLFIWSQTLALPGGNLNLLSKIPSFHIPTRFWIFGIFALLYGIIETLNGNWLSIYMKKNLGASLEIQSLALTAFWGMVTFGRVFYSLMEKYVSERFAFQISPFISAVAFLMIASLKPGSEYWAIAAFGLTGFGCSTLLPLIISFGDKQLGVIASYIPGMVISCYLLGYGIAAFGVGPLEEMEHLSLEKVYVIGAAIAFILGLMSLVIVKTKKEPSI